MEIRPQRPPDKLPNFTTPQKASATLLKDPLLRKLLTQTLEQAYNPHRKLCVNDDDMSYIMRIDRSVADSTGFESGHGSKYFTKRRKHAKTRKIPGNRTEAK